MGNGIKQAVFDSDTGSSCFTEVFSDRARPIILILLDLSRFHISGDDLFRNTSVSGKDHYKTVCLVELQRDMSTFPGISQQLYDVRVHADNGQYGTLHSCVCN